MEQPINQPKNTPDETAINKRIRRRTFIAFGSFIILQAAAYKGWRWLYKIPDETPTITAGARRPLRRALNQNELFFRRFFSGNHLVKTYPKEMAAKKVRINEDIGVNEKQDVTQWKLNVNRAPGDVLTVTLADLQALPKTDIVFDFKCVEGWDQIQHWAGVKFSDFVAHYQLQNLTKMDYVGMVTADKQYYVGLDMDSAMHPQTLLAYEMNDKPLLPRHGAPLRLIIPVKYGIKNIKQIAEITFSNTRPKDYWAEQGYDYYSGL